MFLFLFLVCNGYAELSLPYIFGDGMVLQESECVCVWGHAEVLVKVSVKSSWSSEEHICAADNAGNWKVFIKTPKASFNTYELVITSGQDKVVYKDVLIGQVWLCSGQSNMAFTLARTESADTEIPKANYPNIRYFKVKCKFSDQPLNDITGSWKKCAPDTAKYFSATGYYFGKNLYQKLNKPIGLVDASWGGTPIEAWMPPSCLNEYPEYKTYLEKRWSDYEKKYEGQQRYYVKKLEEYKGGKIKDEPKKPGSKRYQNKSCYLFNGMINPITDFKLKGVIWYQGEANTPYPEYYYKTFPMFIKSWRKLWDESKLPFYYVQLAASTGYGIGVAKVREAQMLTMNKLDTIGMAVTMDIGDATDHHPKNKRDVGYRLALWAFRDVYGFNDVIPSGPLFKSMKIESDKIRVYFDYADNGLIAKGGELTDFAICGTDGKFYPAKAVIDGNAVVVSSDKVGQPVDVSFAWCEYAEPNLYNKEGLPASPFNSRSMN